MILLFIPGLHLGAFTSPGEIRDPSKVFIPPRMRTVTLRSGQVLRTGERGDEGWNVLID